MGRINYIDELKGFTILVVVLAHVYFITLNHPSSTVFRVSASFEMYLFMFISGFVAYLPKNTLNEEQLVAKTKNRVISYIVPGYMISWIVLGIRLLLSQDNSLSFYNFIEGYWYLKSLSIYCLLGYVLYKCKKIWQELTICILVYVLFYIGWKYNKVLNNIFNLEHVVCFFPFYMMGLYARRYDVFTNVKINGWVICSISALLYVLLMSMSLHSHWINTLLQRGVIPIIAIICMIYLFRNREKESTAIDKWLKAIGGCTLDIYLYHVVILGQFFIPIIYTLFYRYTLGGLLEFIFALILTIVITYISIYVGRLVRRSNIGSRLIYGKWN